MMEEKRIKVSFEDTMEKAGIPIVSFHQNDKHFDFIIDTGATYSVINSNSLKDLIYIKLDEDGAIYGIEGDLKKTYLIGAALYIDECEFTEVFQIANVPGIEAINNLYNINVIGILGSTFLTKYRFIIDYEKLYIYGKEDKIEHT